MLTNNFKKFFSFYPDATVVDVLGNEIELKHRLPSSSGGQNNSTGGWNESVLNGHPYLGQGWSFLYNLTLNTNNYTQEQVTYTWHNIVSGADTNTSSDNYYTNVPSMHRHNGLVIFVGTGTTPATVNDYKLESPVALDVFAAKCLCRDALVGNYLDTMRIFVNNTPNSIIVNEVGLYMFSHQGPSYFQYAYPIIMFGRKVLNTPVVLGPGVTYAFTWTLDISQITF